MKKQKLSLAQLKVKSFVTTTPNAFKRTIIGGQKGPTDTLAWHTKVLNCDTYKPCTSWDQGLELSKDVECEN